MSFNAAHRLLGQMLAATVDPASVAWENVSFSPTPGSPWYRESFSPSGAEAESLGPGSFDRLEGLYLIDVFAPSGEGYKRAEELAEDVLAGFARGLATTDGDTTVIVESSFRAAALSEAEWYQIPITIRFRVHRRI